MITRRHSFALVAILTLVVACVSASIWPGDSSWMNDEPALIARSAALNQAGQFATRGLAGNFGVPYGPVPALLYQAMLAVTPGPVALAALHAILMSLTMAAALLWLSRTLRLTPWFVLAAVATPYLSWSQRVLWDATFAIPIGTVALAAYASFLQTRSGRSLMLAVFSSGLLPFIHFQDLPLVAAIFGHLLWLHRPEIRQHLWNLSAVLLFILVLNAAYIVHASRVLIWLLREHGLAGHPLATEPRILSLLYPLIGGRLLCGQSLFSWIADPAWPKSWLSLAELLSYLIVPVAWLGIGVAIRNIMSRRAAGVLPSNDIRRPIFGIAVAGLAMQMGLAFTLRVPNFPQYFYGTFVLHVLFAGWGVESLRRIRVRSVLLICWGIAAAFLNAQNLWRVHSFGYGETTGGPKLANQVEVATALNRYSDKEVLTDVWLYQKFDNPLRALRTMIPPVKGESPTFSGRLFIRSLPGGSGDIELIELPSDQAPREGSSWISVTPLIAEQ